MNGRELIGEGKVAKVYEADGYAYKVFSDNYPDKWIEYEKSIQQEVIKKTKLSVPKIFESDNCKEIKMTYIEGYSLGDRLRRDKYKLALNDLVQLQSSIHQYTNLDIPFAHDALSSQIMQSDLNDDLKRIAMDALSKISHRNNLCHFDFHFLNIMWTETEYVIIDWVNAKMGNPVLDIARTYIILKQYAQRMAGKYLKMMIDVGQYDREVLDYAISVMAIHRLTEIDAQPFKEKLLEIVGNSH